MRGNAVYQCYSFFVRCLNEPFTAPRSIRCYNLEIVKFRLRVPAAYAYLTDHPDTVAVLSGGQGPDEQITEAACMYRELTNMGIDGTRLLLEEKSTSTIENLRFSMEVIGAATGEHPIEIGVISSEYHIFRATRFARDLGLQPVGIPAKTSWVTLRINYYLREIVAVWKYWVLGP